MPITAPGEPIRSHVAQYLTSPTEAAYPRTGRESAYHGCPRAGQCALVYLAEDIDVGFWRSGASDLGDLLLNAIDWITRGEKPFVLDGGGLIEAKGWQTEPGCALHLVNYTNPAFRAGTMRAVHPVGPQRVRMTLADARPVLSAALL